MNQATESQNTNVMPRIFSEATEKPTQEGPDGILYDFNNGCRVFLPETKSNEKWKLRFSDIETGNVIFETDSVGGMYQSTKKYFIPFRIEVLKNNLPFFSHDYCADSLDVQIQIPVGTLGDALAWFPYAISFKEKHKSNITCVVSTPLLGLLQSEYPEVKFLTLSEADMIQDRFYATYRMGLFFDDWGCTYQPVDFRYAGLHKTAAYILGVEPVEIKPRVNTSTSKKKIKEPYVCIAVQSSTQCKYWNNSYGWFELVKWLKESGYRVLCIDKDPIHGQKLSWNYLPHGAEDFTGSLPLSERAALLKGADFFVGLSSGLSWLAWAAGTPVVLISGFTHPNNEFYTPYRVFNHHTCNSCWNDPKVMFDHFDFMWCPRHKGTDRQFECTRLITVDFVKSTISKIPGFLGSKNSKLDQASI